jgi:uncharacterized membrane protein
LISFQAIETKTGLESFVAVDDNTIRNTVLIFQELQLRMLKKQIIKTVESQDQKFIVVSGSLRKVYR